MKKYERNWKDLWRPSWPWTEAGYCLALLHFFNQFRWLIHFLHIFICNFFSNILFVYCFCIVLVFLHFLISKARTRALLPPRCFSTDWASSVRAPQRIWEVENGKRNKENSEIEKGRSLESQFKRSSEIFRDLQRFHFLSISMDGTSCAISLGLRF